MIEIARNKVEIGKNIYRLVKEDGTFIENPVIDGLKVEFMGRMGGVVEIEEGSVFKNTIIRAGGAGYINIKKTHPKGIKNTLIETVCPCKYKYLFIDKNCSIEGARFALIDDDNLIVILGKDCMLSSGIVIRAADGHTIFDINTKLPINNAKPIILGDHIWVGADVTILKGTKIPSNTIIGTGSLVSKEFTEEYSAIAGTPAKVVKTDINWDRARIFEYKRDVLGV